MRPVGEIRTAIYSTIRESGPLTLKDIATKSQVGIGAARKTISNAVRSNGLEIVDRVKVQHCKKRVAIYGIPSDCPEVGDASTHDGGLMVLNGALNAWR